MRIPVFLSILALLSSCHGPVSEKPRLVASSYPIEFLCRQIAGEDFDIVNLVPPGTEPHDYELTISGAKALNDASAFFVNGLGMEPYLDSLRSSIQEKTYILSEGIPTRTVQGNVDPHIWLNTSHYKAMAEKVCSTLSSINKTRAEFYRDNFVSFSNRIDALTDSCAKIAANFENKTIAVSHAAYGYLCDQFGIEQCAINGLSPNQEPSQKAVESLISTIEEKGIDTVFFEELATPDIAESIAKRTGAKTAVLNPLEGLTEEQIQNGEDYFSIYLENMKKIEEAKP